MKKSRFTEDQMVRILREADAEPVAKVAKRHGVSEQTIYAWRKRYGELDVADVRRLRELEAENTRLKKMVAERDLELDVMQEVAKKVVSVAVRRRQVAYAMKRGVSQRRACTLLSVARSALGYESRLAKKDAAVLEAMRELTGQYPRYGYRRIQVFLARRGFEMGAERAHRLWRQAGLQVARRRPRRRIASGRPRPTPPTAANHVWAYDFVYDRCANGQQLKCLTVVDEWTRECLAIEVSGSIRSRGVIDPGKPWQYVTNECSNDKFRDECLGLEWFQSRNEAKVLIETWRRHYNEIRPHSSLGYLTPREFINQSSTEPETAILQ